MEVISIQESTELHTEKELEKQLPINPKTLNK